MAHGARQLSVLSAAASPEWADRTESLLNGDVARRRFNVRLRQAGDREDFPILIVIAVTLTDADRASFPVSGDSPRFAEFEAVVSERVAGRAVLVGVAADAEAWLFFLYAAETSWLPGFEDLFRAVASDHEVGFAVRDDRRWRAFQQYCPQPRNPGRDWALLGIFVLALSLPGFRYSLAWGVGGLLACLVWIVPAAWPGRTALASLRASSVLAFAFAAYFLTTLVLGLVEWFWYPRSPLVGLAAAAGLGLAIAIALSPAQARLRGRMRAREALRTPVGPAA